MIPADDILGAVFHWDPTRQNNLHRWVVLTEADSSNLCVAVSLTDATKYPVNPFIWESGVSVGGSERLIKPSVLRIDMAWLGSHEQIQKDGIYVGHLGMDIQLKAMHEICQLKSILRPKLKQYLTYIIESWCDDCPLR